MPITLDQDDRWARLPGGKEMLLATASSGMTHGYKLAGQAEKRALSTG